MSSTPIPLVDLRFQHRLVADQVNARVTEIHEAGCFIGGPDVGQFEQAYAKFVGAAHCVGVGNGTDALILALQAAKLPADSEVVIPANTFIATAEAVVRAGHRVRLVDCDPTYYLIDPDQARAAVGPDTGAVLAVDLYGQVAPFDALGDCGVPLLEDAAQSQGARRHGQAAGTFGRAAGVSFYPGKNLGAYGDAGAVITNDARLAEDVRALGAHGGTRKYEHRLLGTNSRLDTVQAAVLLAKLAHLAEWNQMRRVAADRYHELLGDIEGVTRPSTLAGNEHVWHLYVIQVDHRNEVLARLHEQGIGAGIHYPDPVHRTGAFAYLDLAEGSFPVAERLAGRIISLPLFPGITEDQQVRVADALRQAVQG